MGILQEISNRKAKFKEAQNAFQNKRMESKKALADQYEMERKQIEEQNKAVARYEEQKGLLRTAKKERFKGTLTGKVVSNIKGKIEENKQSNSGIFTQQGQNVFTQGFQNSNSNNIFTSGQSDRSVFTGTPTIKKKKK